MTRSSLTTRVYLLKRPRKIDGRKVHYHVLRWSGRGGKQHSESLGRTTKMTFAEAKRRRAAKEADFNSGAVPVERGVSMTLADFRGFYWDERRRGDAPKLRQTTKRNVKLSDTTLYLHDMVIRYLIEHFGESHHLDEIDELAAEKWHEALADGKLAGARLGGHWGKRGLSENSLRSKSRTAKAIFSWARTHKLVRTNPFQDFTGNAVKVRPNPDVPIEVVRKVIDQCPQPWKALIALCRFAGLRRGEALSLPWKDVRIDHDGAEMRVGVDFDRKRLMVVGKGDRYREVPICTELDSILVATLDAAPEGTLYVTHPLAGTDLCRQLYLYVEAAGLTPWRKAFQSMRSSCENAWKLKVSEVTYAAWLGHSIEVSRKHYVAPLASEFDLVTAE